MEIDRVWAVYFSATDTTKKIVTVLAGEAARTLRAEYCEYDFTLPAARKDLLVFGPRDLVIFGTPVYAMFCLAFCRSISRAVMPVRCRLRFTATETMTMP